MVLFQFRRHIKIVIEYIKGQREHHQHSSFEESISE